MERDNTALLASLKQHEGYEDFPYLDSEKNLTVGYGHRIKEGEDFSQGVHPESAEKILLQDVAQAQAEAEGYQFYHKLSPPRQDVMIEMIYNMGLPTFMTFEKTIKAMRKGTEGDERGFDRAANEMLWNTTSKKTKWHSQVKGRAVTLSNRMKGEGV